MPQLVAALAFLSSRPKLASEMGRAGRDLLQRDYTPEAHYAALINLYERLAKDSKQTSQALKETNRKLVIARTETSATRSAGTSFVPLHRLELAQVPQLSSTATIELPKPTLRIAFIGGRGVISKYSGIETYYEEAGERLADMGHPITAYCRTYFTPAVAKHNGMRVVRLPTFRSKHLETLVHTFLSTLSCTRTTLRYRALPRFGSRIVFVYSTACRQKDSRYGARPGLAAQEVGPARVGCAPDWGVRRGPFADANGSRLAYVASALLGSPPCGNALCAEWRVATGAARP